MSKIEAEVTALQVVGVVCDACGKHASNEQAAKGWEHFGGGHTEWGSDSGDSHECYDVCSFPCFHKCLVQEVRRLQGARGAEIGFIELWVWEAILNKIGWTTDGN